MSENFRMPDPGEGLHEVEIVDVHVDSGDEVKDGDALFTIESDKATIDVPASFDGRIDEVRTSKGERIDVGEILLTYSVDGGGDSDVAESADSQRDDAARSAGERGAGERGSGERGDDDAERADSDAGSERDEQTPERQSLVQSAEAGASSSARSNGDGAGREPALRASPATRRRARQLDVTLESAQPSGEGGRILKSDVEAAAMQTRNARADDGAGIDRIPLAGVRAVTARRMQEAWSTIPHVTHWDSVDITELEQFRAEHRADVEAYGGKLTITVIVAKVLAATLRRFPRFNARLDADSDEIVMLRDCHLGIAVATDQGLLVPVIRHADKKSIREIAVETHELAEKARSRDLPPEALSGSTFTISNPGGIGGECFTPIINPPEAAILGIARARRTPVIVGEPDRLRLEARMMLPMILTFDHRINDGADAARFVRHLGDMLANPRSFAVRL